MGYLSYYTIQMILTVVLMAMMILMVSGSQLLSRIRARSFIISFIMIALAAISEWIGVYVNGNPEMRTLHLVAKAFELSIAPFIPVVIAISIGSRKRVSVLSAVMCANVPLEITSIFRELVFSVDENGFYTHDKLYFVYYLFVAVGVMYLIAETYMLSRHNMSYRSHCLFAILLLLILSAVPHFIKSEWRFEWITSGICVALFHLYYTDTRMIMDGLTNVFGRIAYEKQLSALSELTVIVSFDVNDFKHVNDRYGHLYGDEVLKSVAFEIKNAYGKYGRCYRTGGDEFCALLMRKHPPLEDLNESFTNAIAARSREDKRFPSVSLGYSMYTPGTSVIEAVKNADMMMYKHKNSR